MNPVTSSRPGVKPPPPDHELTYRKTNLAGFIHRNRLRAVFRMFERYVSPATTSWADFGCSNGFIMQEIVKLGRYSFARLAGFDVVAELLEAARAKGIPNARFDTFNLNAVQPVRETFALVTCMETLEHVGNLENAIANLVNHVEKGGLLLITAPNETGGPGLVKFFARMALRRNAYGDFFARGGRSDYVNALLHGGRIDRFREPARHGWGPHLGFDYRVMEAQIDARYVQSGILAPVARDRASLGMNFIYLYRRQA